MSNLVQYALLGDAAVGRWQPGREKEVVPIESGLDQKGGTSGTPSAEP